MIIGRKKELEVLEKIYKSREAEFLTIYGRRRVGKTYLIREFFSQKKCKFLHATGIHKGTKKTQLKKFNEVLSLTFFDGAPLAPLKEWSEAFQILQTQISKCKEKVVIFFDELPWMATKKSRLLEELEYYWNRYWSGMSQVIVVVCGSSASWLIKKIIYNKGGLHNRTTCQIRLLPFNLFETNLYLKSRGVSLNQRHTLTLYMALGGIPYYLRYVDPGLSAEQNIQKMIFETNGPLTDEYNKLFDSLFEQAQIYKQLVHKIARKKEGISRVELGRKNTVFETGGRLSERLDDLKATGFIQEYVPWGHKRGVYYKVIDEFCLFYLHFIEPQKGKSFAKNFWMYQSQRPAYYAWSGYAFEAVCMKHIDQIMQSLNIQASSTIGSWRLTVRKGALENGFQIDLIIDRTDDAINICEIKYTDSPFVIDKQYSVKLEATMAEFKRKTGTEKQLFLTFISASGLKKTLYAEEMVANVVRLDDLFNKD